MIAQWDLCLCERIGSHAKEWWMGTGDERLVIRGWGVVSGEW